MAEIMRWRYGETNPVIGYVQNAVGIEIGDLVYRDGDNVKPANLQTNQTTKTLNQSTFATNFLGVAMQSSQIGEASSIRIATTGTFEFDCNANTFILGNMVGIDELPGRTGLEKQKVDIVTATAGAIGRVAKREPTQTKSVLVNIKSTIMEGGVK